MSGMAEHEAGRLAQPHSSAPPVPEAWQKTELARHPERPYPMDFMQALFTDFSEIHGDRAFGDDAAMACGMARFHGRPVAVIGNLKGRTLKERVERKFGSPDPEGYRKALRVMKIAEKFGHPVFTFLDLASIMWKDASKKQQAAAALKYTAYNVKELGCVDDVLTEPDGGTHTDPACAMSMIDERLQYHLAQVDHIPIDRLLEERYQKFRNIAQFYVTAG
jgi:acetyl-CoA carboxylase alpha subunit